jgi:hypothetical protein
VSAWARLVQWDGSAEFLELCNAALAEVQRETSRRNAAQIRADVDAGEFCVSQVDGARDAANRIDPDREES